MLREPAGIHFQHVTHGLAGAVWFGRLRLHFVQIDDGAVVIDERNLQRDEGVFHPEALLGLLLEHEDHAVVVTHVGAEHQSDLMLPWAGCDFCLDVDEAGTQRHGRQWRLGRILGVGGDAGAQRQRTCGEPCGPFSRQTGHHLLGFLKDNGDLCLGIIHNIGSLGVGLAPHMFE